MMAQGSLSKTYLHPDIYSQLSTGAPGTVLYLSIVVFTVRMAIFVFKTFKFRSGSYLDQIKVVVIEGQSNLSKPSYALFCALAFTIFIITKFYLFDKVDSSTAFYWTIIGFIVFHIIMPYILNTAFR